MATPLKKVTFLRKPSVLLRKSELSPFPAENLVDPIFCWSNSESSSYTESAPASLHSEEVLSPSPPQPQALTIFPWWFMNLRLGDDIDAPLRAEHSKVTHSLRHNTFLTNPLSYKFDNDLYSPYSGAKFYCVYVPHCHCPFICWWVSPLVPGFLQFE